MNKKSILKFILSWILLSCMVLTAAHCWAQSPPTVADFEQPFFGLQRQGTTANQKQVTLIVIGWQPRNKGEPVLTAPQLQNLFFDANNSVAHWFQENSQDRYRLIPHPTNAVMGPYLSVHDWRFYWRTGPFDPATLPIGDPHRYVHTDGKVYYLDDDGFIGGHRHAWAEAIRAAANQINFSDFDQDNNGDLSTDECLVVIVKAQANNFGTRRNASGSDVPHTLLQVDGVTIRVVCELYAGPPHGSDDLAVAIEEVLHLAANLADQYPDVQENYPDGRYRRTDDPGRPGQLALTDAGSRPVHIDPYHKLKWGWLNPQLADHSGRYTLQAAATTGDALILYSPYFGTDEFFILENRWRGNSYDRFRDNNRGEGLALWHCIQDQKLSSDWARRAVHLRRADPRLEIKKGHEDRYKFMLNSTGDGYHYIQHKYSGKYICTGSKNNGALIHIWGPIPSGHEDRYKFKLSSTGDGYNYIEHKHSGKYICTGEKKNGANIHLWGPIPSGHEDRYKFKLSSTGDGYHYILHKHSKKYVCSGEQANGSNIHLWGPGIKWDITLFDGQSTVRGYDIHDNSTPQNLHLRDGTPSRIQLRNISNAGATMTVDVTVPPAKGEIINTKGRIKMIRVHAKDSGYGPSKYKLNEDAIVTLDSNPGSVFGIDLNTRDGIEMFNMLREAFEDGTTITVEYKAVNAIGGRIIRVIESQ